MIRCFVMDTVPRAVDGSDGDGGCGSHQNSRTFRASMFRHVGNDPTVVGGLARHRIVAAQLHRLVGVITIACPTRHKACVLEVGSESISNKK